MKPACSTCTDNAAWYNYDYNRCCCTLQLLSCIRCSWGFWNRSSNITDLLLCLVFHLTQSYCISIFTQPYSEFIGPGVSTLLLHFCSCFWQNLMMFFQVEIKKQPGATLAGLFGNSRILSRQQTTCRLKHRTVQNSWARRRQFSWNQTEAAKNRVDQ